MSKEKGERCGCWRADERCVWGMTHYGQKDPRKKWGLVSDSTRRPTGRKGILTGSCTADKHQLQLSALFQASSGSTTACPNTSAHLTRFYGSGQDRFTLSFLSPPQKKSGFKIRITFIRQATNPGQRWSICPQTKKGKGRQTKKEKGKTDRKTERKGKTKVMCSEVVWFQSLSWNSSISKHSQQSPACVFDTAHHASRPAAVWCFVSNRGLIKKTSWHDLSKEKPFVFPSLLISTHLIFSCRKRINGWYLCFAGGGTPLLEKCASHKGMK